MDTSLVLIDRKTIARVEIISPKNWSDGTSRTSGMRAQKDHLQQHNETGLERRVDLNEWRASGEGSGSLKRD